VNWRAVAWQSDGGATPMGEHQLRDSIPWWYWTMRFDFRQHYRWRYEERYCRSTLGALLPSVMLIAGPYLNAVASKRRFPK
jgi:hypothetical protein